MELKLINEKLEVLVFLDILVFMQIKITSGEGGIITTNSKKYFEKPKLYRNLGFTKPRFVHFVRGLILE